MEDIRRKRMLWRIPLVVAIFVALFWGIWYVVTGDIPATTQIILNKDTVIQLSFATMSRLWDIVFASIWAFLVIFLFTDKRIIKEGIIKEGILVIILVISLVLGLSFGLVSGLGLGLVIGLGFGLAILVTGLVGVLLGVLLTSLFASLVALVKFIFFRKTWVSFCHWLAGK